MNRILMISDIHGCLHSFQQLLTLVSFNEATDQLILLGDYVDKGPNSRDTVEFVQELVEHRHAIALRGNHDQRLVDLIRTNNAAVREKFIEHGGIQTLQSYCDTENDFREVAHFDEAIQYIRDYYQRHITFLAALPLYYEDHNHIYVHAGLNPQYTNWRKQPDHNFMYIKEPFHSSRSIWDKTVVFGHTRTIELHGRPDVWFDQGKIGIDGGCSFGLQLNGLIYENGHYETVHVTNSRYPL